MNRFTQAAINADRAVEYALTKKQRRKGEGRMMLLCGILLFSIAIGIQLGRM